MFMSTLLNVDVNIVVVANMVKMLMSALLNAVGNIVKC